jgi:hypothetical protein
VWVPIGYANAGRCAVKPDHSTRSYHPSVALITAGATPGHSAALSSTSNATPGAAPPLWLTGPRPAFGLCSRLQLAPRLTDQNSGRLSCVAIASSFFVPAGSTHYFLSARLPNAISARSSAPEAQRAALASRLWYWRLPVGRIPAGWRRRVGCGPARGSAPITASAAVTGRVLAGRDLNRQPLRRLMSCEFVGPTNTCA